MKTFQQYITESGPRVRIVKVRIRNGKIQRRKKVSNVPGYRINPRGTLVRISAQERMHRKRGARKGKIKRRAKQARALIKRRRSLQKLKNMGVGR